MVTVTPEASLYQVMKILEENQFEGLPIVDQGKVIGIVDERIIMREFCACCAQQNQEAGIDTDMPIPFASTKVTIEPDKRRIAHFLHRRNVSELVLHDEEVVVVNADEPIEQASYLMFRHSVDILPVIDDDNQLVGFSPKAISSGCLTKSLVTDPKGGDRVMIAVPDVVGRLADITGLMKKKRYQHRDHHLYPKPAYTVMVIMKVERARARKPEAAGAQWV